MERKNWKEKEKGVVGQNVSNKRWTDQSLGALRSHSKWFLSISGGCQYGCSFCFKVIFFSGRLNF